MHIPDAELEWRFTGSGGPGGQHANTSNTRVELVFDIAASASLSDAARQRLLAALGPQVRVVCSASRSQRRNRDRARQLLDQRIAEALATPTQRRPTRPGRGAVERRITAKRQRSQTKARRRWRNEGRTED
jgi:ribosome-associated protein